MLLRDASGRTVSILNEGNDNFYHNNDYQSHQTSAVSRYCSSQRERTASIPVSLPPLQASRAWDVLPPSNTPVLLRSDSFDSQISCDLTSPLTPISAYHDCPGGDGTAGCRSPFYSHASNDLSRARQDVAMKSVASESRRSSSSTAVGKEPTAERKGGKRYSCRYAEELSCDRTFTTSGHASRHAKIHFAMRTVPCTYENCTKMFTRSDNMKQHLETHYKRVGARQPPSGGGGGGGGGGSDSEPRGHSRPTSKKRALSPADLDRVSSSEFELPMRPSRSRRLGSADSGTSVASSALDTLVYAASKRGKLEARTSFHRERPAV